MSVSRGCWARRGCRRNNRVRRDAYSGGLIGKRMQTRPGPPYGPAVATDPLAAFEAAPRRSAMGCCALGIHVGKGGGRLPCRLAASPRGDSWASSFTGVKITAYRRRLTSKRPPSGSYHARDALAVIVYVFGRELGTSAQRNTPYGSPARA